MVGVVVAKIIDFPYENHDPHRAKSIEIGVGRNREFMVFPSEKRDFSSENAHRAEDAPRRSTVILSTRSSGGSAFVSPVTLLTTAVFPLKITLPVT